MCSLSLSLSTCTASSHVVKRNTNCHLPVPFLHQTLAAPWRCSTHTTLPLTSAPIPVAVAVKVPAPLTDPTPTMCHLITCRLCCSYSHREAPPHPHCSCCLTLVHGSFLIPPSPIYVHQNMRASVTTLVTHCDDEENILRYHSTSHFVPIEYKSYPVGLNSCLL